MNQLCTWLSEWLEVTILKIFKLTSNCQIDSLLSYDELNDLAMRQKKKKHRYRPKTYWIMRHLFLECKPIRVEVLKKIIQADITVLPVYDIYLSCTPEKSEQ